MLHRTERWSYHLDEARVVKQPVQIVCSPEQGSNAGSPPDPIPKIFCIHQFLHDITYTISRREEASENFILHEQKHDMQNADDFQRPSCRRVVPRTHTDASGNPPPPLPIPIS